MGAGFVKRLMSCGAKNLRGGNRVFDNDEAGDGRIRVHVQGKDNDAVCVELPTHYLNHPVFEKLLKDSGEEFGFRYDGALRIACDVEVFLRFVHLLNTGDPSAHYFQLPQ
uniref:Small auxin up regulated protein n=1 Tax=Kalanchoe fedtschenkoi TaxID=63787 RepID=A0A7N0UHW5_KALFE